MIRKRVLVSGLVQGVFYRDTCRRTATEHRVAGWVRNVDDGTVEAVFEGADDAVARLVEWAGSGPPHARVERIEVIDEQPEGLQGFRVRVGPRD